MGEVGQARLLKSKVLLLGAGGLGSPASMYLAAAGVGTLGIVDADVVDASNLQRQIVHATSRVGMAKVESAAKAIAELNPDVKVVPYMERLNSGNVDRIFGDYEVVVDGTDNFPTRYLVNDASVFLGKPVVHGSIFRFDGQVTTFIPEKAAKKLGMRNGPLLPVPVPRAPAAPPGSELPGGRRPRHPLRHHRHAPGDRGDQDPARPRDHARGAAAHLRQPEDEVPRAQAPPRSALPGVRAGRDDQELHRLRGLLRDRVIGRLARGLSSGHAHPQLASWPPHAGHCSNSHPAPCKSK